MENVFGDNNLIYFSFFNKNNASIHIEISQINKIL